MKLQYFLQATADADDQLLAAAKALGTVPDTCLLGGRLVQAARLARQDPCVSCLGPRDKCKGREAKATSGLTPNQERLRKLLTGEKDDDPISDLIRKG